jgi:opacity protein-like surface antigen
MWLMDATIEFEDGAELFEIDHRVGVDGDLVAGYDFGLFRAEFEGGYKWAKHRRYTDGPNEADAASHSPAYSFMCNALIDLGHNERVNFYGGGGVGIAFVRQ